MPAPRKPKLTKQVTEGIKNNVITVKVQLHLIKEGESDSEKKKYTDGVFKDLRQLEKDTYQSFNKLMTRSFIIRNELGDFTYGKKGSPERELYESKLKYICDTLGLSKDEYTSITQHGEFKGFTQTASRLGMTYNKSSSYKDFTHGKAALPSMKMGCPIPLNKQGSTLKYDENTKKFIFRIPKGYRFELNDKLSEDRKNHLLNCLKGTEGYSRGDPSIQLKNNKLFLLQPVSIPSRNEGLDFNIIAGVDLGINIPATISLYNAKEPKYSIHKFLGSKKDFLRERMSIKNQLRSAQRNNMGMSGKGRKKKLVALDRFTEKERNFCRTYNHKISKSIIEFCVKNHAGILQMENLSGFGNKEKSKEFILRNWSYFELQSMIKYKANLAGIKVVFIKPEYTSQMCPKCDAVDSKSRYDPKDKTKFKCTGCGYEIHADLNGAINIARSKNYVNEAIDETVDL